MTRALEKLRLSRPDEPKAPGQMPVPSWRLSAYLGKGNCGEVWQAVGPGDRECALKFVPLEGGVGVSEYRSIKLLNKVHHPNLAECFAVWFKDADGWLVDDNSTGTAEIRQLDGELILAMQLGEKTLADYLQECQRANLEGVPKRDLLEFFEQAANGIDFLHQPHHDLGRGQRSALRHGDIKPGNMLIVGGRGLQMCDFGLTELLGDPRNSRGALRGTPAYASPEIINHRDGVAASDQYSLAVSYVELRTGRLPYDADQKYAIMGMIGSGAVILDFLPTEEQRVLQRALAFKPDDRYPNCREFVEALKRSKKPPKTEVDIDPWRKPQTADIFRPGGDLETGHQLVERIGRGTFGDVWRALDHHGREVALKVVADVSALTDEAAWFRLNALVDRLEHPRLLQVKAYWALDSWGHVIPQQTLGQPDATHPSFVVLLMRMAARNALTRLHECCEQGLPGIPEKELLAYMRQAALALDYLNNTPHPAGDCHGAIVHRNIKPENILLTQDNQVLVADAGLARALHGPVANVSTNTHGLTPYYSPPELLKRAISQTSDQYSLAVTFFHLRTGRLPIDTELSFWEQSKLMISAELDLRDLNEFERAAIAKATRLDPTERFDSCISMVNALEDKTGRWLPVPIVVPANTDVPPEPAEPLEDLYKTDPHGMLPQFSELESTRPQPQPSKVDPDRVPRSIRDTPNPKMETDGPDGPVYQPPVVDPPSVDEPEPEMETESPAEPPPPPVKSHVPWIVAGNVALILSLGAFAYYLTGSWTTALLATGAVTVLALLMAGVATLIVALNRRPTREAEECRDALPPRRDRQAVRRHARRDQWR